MTSGLYRFLLGYPSGASLGSSTLLVEEEGHFFFLREDVQAQSPGGRQPFIFRKGSADVVEPTCLLCSGSIHIETGSQFSCDLAHVDTMAGGVRAFGVNQKSSDALSEVTTQLEIFGQFLKDGMQAVNPRPFGVRCLRVQRPRR